MSNLTFFKDTNTVPSEGLFFYETHGERVTGRTYLEIEAKVRALMNKYNIGGMAEAHIAAYMCPRIKDPGRYCTGENVEPAHVRPREAYENSLKYCGMRTVSFDRIERRMEKCSLCPMHARDWCPTCNGAVARITSAFGGNRPELPGDVASGVCQCAKAYEMAIASVDYDEKEPVWDGAPTTCWRITDV